MRALFVLGRTIFGGFFIYNGLNHFLSRQSMRQYASSKGVPAPAAAVPATGAMLVAGGLSVLAGLRPRQGLAAIVGFLVPVTLEMHRFWDEPDANRRTAELVNFSKNLALIGAALALMEVDTPWPISVDERRADGEDMFIHLGGRDLRALPA
jgi:putative oxidoreductase